MEVKEFDFAEIPQKALNILTKPAEFFKSMHKSGGFLEPVIFAIIMGIVAGIIQAIINILGLSYVSRGFLDSLGLIIFIPLAVIIGSFIGAAIMYFIWKLMGSQENYETSYRCVAYLTVLAPIAAILGVIPYAGVILNALIGLFFIVMASIYVHNIEAKKAWLVFGILFALLVLIQIRAEYKFRNFSSSADEVRKKMEELNKQYQQQLEEARKQAERYR